MRALWTLVPLIGLAWGQGLDLATLLRLLPQSPGWQALEAQYAQAQASYQAALAALGLKVAASGGLAYQSLQGQANTRESLSLSANLLALPYGPAQESARQARMALLRADLSRRSGEMDLLFTLLQQYWGAYLAEKNLEVAQRALAVAQEAYRVAQAKRLQGLLSETGLKQAAQALAQAQAALVQAQTQEAAARTALYATLGQAPGPPPPRTSFPLPLPLHPLGGGPAGGGRAA
ncbi:TolC family protein [Thermus caldilimi]|uniref:TolC family protein n=1 Tax=Thermus caldilimi TaxID=2483360 RepID=UPI001076BA1B|nr:TolC family protein [Thermus caldilimi]